MATDGRDGERCGSAEGSDAMRKYHDDEWGVPSHDDPHLFEMLVLEGAQAGLSWSSILDKRENHRRAFDGFDVERIAAYDEDEIAALLADAGIVRNRLEVRGTVSNARAFLAAQAELGSFADRVSKELERRGFTFVGTTIVYSFLQAVGLVDDHLVGCPWKTGA
jgi:DNA-3-methyladenine glycosylase I